MNSDLLAESLKVKAADRHYQVWERNSLRIDLYTEKVFLQKMNYIHNNPVTSKWRFVDLPENYRFSSAKFYETWIDDFFLLTHYRG